jgi:hypothetical protein
MHSKRAQASSASSMTPSKVGRTVCDVSGPNLIRSIDHQIPQQVRINLVCLISKTQIPLWRQGGYAHNATDFNRPHEVKAHVRGAVNNGCTKDEIMKTFLQAAIYCGVPAGIDSFRTAKEVFDEMDVE